MFVYYFAVKAGVENEIESGWTCHKFDGKTVNYGETAYINLLSLSAISGQCERLYRKL